MFYSVTQRAVRDDSSAERTQPNPMHGFTDKCKTARDLEKSLFSTLSTDLLRSEGNTGPSHNKIEEKERRSQSKALKGELLLAFYFLFVVVFSANIYGEVPANVCPQ